MGCSNTIPDVNVLQRRHLYIDQPMLFHCDQKLHLEAATRNLSMQDSGCAIPAWRTNQIGSFKNRSLQLS